MGLDMYLTKKKYIGGNYSHRKVTGSVKLTVNTGTEHEQLIEIAPDQISEITMSVGYWRKANQIHNWFVKNAQNGRDECQESWVSQNQLAELKGICEGILKARDIHGQDSPEVLNLINEQLPPSAGFFFGSTDINDYYFEDLEHTVVLLSEVDPSEDMDYYYQSSW